MEFKKGGNLWGVHRVIEPRGGLPQSAFKLEASLPSFENELVVNVRRLQIDSASFHQLSGGNTGDMASVAQKISSIVAERGKMHNPVTNSGGVFLGKLGFVGPLHPLRGQLHEGDEVISLVSLTLTPLSINKVGPINAVKETVDVEGHAVVFESGMVKRMPEDFSEGVALAAMDICGAPAQVKRLIHPRDKVLVVGLGKAGR